MSIDSIPEIFHQKVSDIYHMKKQGYCPRCNQNKIITDFESQEILCSICGLVIKEKLEDSGPGRIFLDESKGAGHNGDKSTLIQHDRGLNTIINPQDKDSFGNPISNDMRASIRRLRLWNNRTISHSTLNKNLQHALQILLNLKHKLSLTDAIIEKASYLYRKALEKKLGKGRSITSLISAALYAACRQSSTPRTLNEISSIANIKKKELSSCYRLLVKELDLKMPVMDSVQCISRIASQTGISEKVKRQAIKIIKNAEKNHLVEGKDPMGVAATSLYIAGIKTEEGYTQKEMATAAGVTEVTIRNRFKTLKKMVL